MPKGIRKKAIVKPQTYEEVLIDGATESASEYLNNLKNLQANNKDILHIKQEIEKLKAQLQNKTQESNQLEETVKRAQGAADSWGRIICSIKKMSFEEMETLVGLALALSKPIENPIIHDYFSELQRKGHEQLLSGKYTEFLAQIRECSRIENPATSDEENKAASIDSNGDGT